MPISLLPICGKMFEKIIFNNIYSYLNANNLITKKQSGFRPGDSTSNQLLYLVNEIHEAFEDTKSLEVCAVFLDISKAFDKVWNDGLILKLKQNGISGSLIKLLENYHNFIDTFSGICHCNRGIWETHHFLLLCLSYAIQRVKLVTSVKEILFKVNWSHLENQLQLYLYGDPSINDSDNKKILMSMIKLSSKPSESKHR